MEDGGSEMGIMVAGKIKRGWIGMDSSSADERLNRSR